MWYAYDVLLHRCVARRQLILVLDLWVVCPAICLISLSEHESSVFDRISWQMQNTTISNLNFICPLHWIELLTNHIPTSFSADVLLPPMQDLSIDHHYKHDFYYSPNTITEQEKLINRNIFSFRSSGRRNALVELSSLYACLFLNYCDVSAYNAHSLISTVKRKRMPTIEHLAQNEKKKGKAYMLV